MTEIHVDDSGALKFEGELNIGKAKEIYEKLRSLSLLDYPELTLDLSALQELDTAGVQLLLALRKSHPKTRVHSCPAQLRSFVEQIGLEQMLL